MKIGICMLSAIFILTACTKSTEKGRIDLVTIPLENAIEHPTKITTSMLGKSVRYVQLETNAESMIGNSPSVRVVGDRVIVASDGTLIKVFDALSGKFLNTIGEFGSGPRASLFLTYYLYNPYTNQVWVRGNGNQREFRVWGIDGTYHTSVTMPELNLEYNVFAAGTEFVDTASLVTYSGTDFVFYGSDTITKRISINKLADNSNPKNWDVIMKRNVDGVGGTLLDEPALIYSLQDERKVHCFQSQRPFYRYNDELYYKNMYENGAYRVEMDTVIQTTLFDPGKYNLPYEEIGTKIETNKKLRVAQVLENDKCMFFECVFDEGLYALYNKQNKEVVTSSAKERIKDDLNDFLSFNIYSTTSDGKFVGVIDALKVVEWNEENPSKRTPLPNITENSNIVIAIIE